MRHHTIFSVLATLLLSGAIAAQDPVCVPQFVNGSAGPFHWETTLVLQNQDQNQAQVRLHFFTNDGMSMTEVQLREKVGRGPGNTVGPDGQFETRAIEGRSFRSYRSDGTGPFQAGFVCVESQSRIRAHAMLHLTDSQGNLISETGVIPGQAFQRGGFFADQTGGMGVGFACLNPARDQSASCTFELYEEGGVEPLGTADFTLEPRAQIARHLFELFPELLTDAVGFVRVECDNPIWAMALQLRGLQMLQIPVFVETVQP